MTNMLTTECSNPWAKNTRIGIQAPAMRPMVEVEVSAITTPRQTIQLQRIALTKTVIMPAVAEMRVADGLRLGGLDDGGRDAGWLDLAGHGQRDREQDGVDDAADEVAEEYPGPIGQHRAAGVAGRRITARGTRAKLPVTSSSPSSTIITKPTGKIRAPTMGWPVCTVAPIARLVAKPRSAPESAPRIRRSNGPSSDFAMPVRTMLATISAGFRLSMGPPCAGLVLIERRQ